LSREKARTPARKKRPASKGPKKRVGGNHGNGKKFQPGTNSHTGETFHRGPDDIPRGSVNLLLKVVLHDKREALYENLSKLCETPAGALKFAELAGDRLEGKPTQKHEVLPPRQTVFEQADPTDQGASGPPPPPRGAAAAGAPARDISIRAPDGTVLRPLD